jgi:hypothetical protein
MPFVLIPDRKADHMQFGDTLSGTLKDRATDKYALTAPSGGAVSFALLHPDGVGSDGQPIGLKLLDAAGNTIAVLTARGNDTLLATVPSSGEYSLQVIDSDAYVDPPRDYRIVTALAGAPHTTYDGGTNNTAATAIATPLGDPIRGRIEDGDTDYFRIQADTGGVLTLRFAHPYGPGTGGAGIGVAVMDGNGHTVITRTLTGDAVLQTTVAHAGTYYISIADSIHYYPNDRGLYTLTPALNHYPGIVYDGPDNNSPQTALPLDLGATAVGVLEAYDNDYFKIVASAGGRLSLNFMHPSGPGTGGDGLDVIITDGNGKQIVAKQERGSDMITADLANGGPYYVKVGNASYRPEAGLYKLMAGVTGNGGKTIVVPDATPFHGTGGNDVVQGSTGRDTMVLHGNAAGFDINVSPAGATVRDRSGAEGTDTLFNVERLKFDDKYVALDVDGDAGRVFRLYQAAFDRAPDEAGLGFWINQVDHGARLHLVAEGFVASQEFHDRYGDHPTNAQLVTAFYQNILHRAPDQAGADYWTHALDTGIADRPDVLVNIANSEENIALLVGSTMHGMSYVPYP